MNRFKICGLVTGLLILVFTIIPSRAGGRFVVVATTPELATIAGEVLGQPGSVYSIAKPDEDPHYVPAKPSQMVKLRDANAVVYNGLELEIGWLPLLLGGARNPNIMPGRPGNLDASKAIKKILEVPTGEVDRSMGDIHPMGNPHYMMSPYNCILVAKWMAEQFGKLDGANAQTYHANAAKFENMMQNRIGQWEKQAQSLNNLKIIAYHNTWVYLADWLHLNVMGYIEDRPGIPPTPRHIMDLQQLIKSQSIKIIIKESFTPPHAPDSLAKATGAKVVVLPSTVTGEEGVKSYPDIFEQIIKRLLDAAR